MTLSEKYDRNITGIVSGILLPLVVGLCIYLFSSKGLSPGEYLEKISRGNIMTHAISLCVFPNVIIFLIYNRFDMLKACRGVLAVTIGWAAVVFLIKFFG